MVAVIGALGLGRIACRLGRHAPAPDEVWNGGYCFTSCRRCHRDMVRSAFGEWHVPRHHRVVWAPPGSAPDAVAPVPIAPADRQRLAGDAGERSPFDFADFDPAALDAEARPARRTARRC